MPNLPWRYTGSVMEPMLPLQADQAYVKGRTYFLSDRSEETHKHHFAWLKTAFDNLPEAEADRFPTVEHLRKWALIETGYFNEQRIDVGTIKGAERVAAYCRYNDPLAVVVTRGPFVVVRTALSQSVRAMGGADFQKSKEAIREIVANLIGIKPEELDRNVHAAAQ